jgi:hypothetical protein
MPGIMPSSVWCACSEGMSCPRARSQARIMSISSAWETAMRWPSSFISSREVRASMSAVISMAWAWWPIIPCMNFTSAGVACTFDRSVAASAVRTRFASPGAPGWMIWVPAVPPALRQAALSNTAATAAASRKDMGMAEGYTGCRLRGH